MPHPCPHHCPPSRGGAAWLAVLVVLVVIAAAAARAAVHAAAQLLEVALIATGSILGLGAIGTMAYVALRLHHSHALDRQAMPRHTPVILSTAQRLSAPRPRAIEAPRATLADLERLAAEHGYNVIRKAQDDD